jgi:alkylmercury lyase
LTLLRLLAQGRPVSLAAAAEAAAQAEDEILTKLRSWPNAHYDDGDRIVALCGLTLRPTPHSFEVGGKQLHTWCAWDTLSLPVLLDASATVKSTCPVTEPQWR